jgi:hypothetical protein
MTAEEKEMMTMIVVVHQSRRRLRRGPASQSLLPDFFSHASLVPELHRQIRRFHADACTTQWQDLRKH